MAYVAPSTHSPGDLITASDWNQFIRDNWNSLSGLIAYVNSGSPLSGWTEFTTARGLFILGAVSSGTLATAVGTPLTNQQNVTHSHSVPPTGYSGTQAVAGVSIDSNNSPASGPTSGSASAGSSGTPYIQLTCIQRS